MKLNHAERALARRLPRGRSRRRFEQNLRIAKRNGWLNQGAEAVWECLEEHLVGSFWGADSHGR